MFLTAKGFDQFVTESSFFYIIPIAVFVITTLNILFRYSRTSAYQFFALVNLLLALKYIAEFFLVTPYFQKYRLILLHVLLSFYVFFPASYFYYLTAVTSNYKISLKYKLSIVIFILIFTIAQILEPDFFFNLQHTETSSQYSPVGILMVPAFFVTLYFMLSMMFFVLKIRRQHFKLQLNLPKDRLNIIYIASGLLSVYSLRFYFHSVPFIVTDIAAAVILFNIASFKPIWRSSELSKKAIYWFLASSIPVIPLGLLLYFIILNLKTIDTKIALGLILFYFYAMFYYFRFFQPKIDKYFDRVPKEIEDLLDQYKSKLITLLPIKQLIVNLKEVVGNLAKITHYDVLTWNEEDGSFTPIGMAAPPDKLKFRIFNDFILWLGENDKVYFKDEFLLNDKLAPIRDQALDFFERTQAHLIIPFVLNRAVLAILYLGRKIKENRFSNDEIFLLSEIRNITSIALSNAVLYERIQALNLNLEQKVKNRTRALEDAQSQLVHTEKLASLGVMVAGIAHEINTPVGVINGSIENIQNNIQELQQFVLQGKNAEITAIFNQMIQKLSGQKNILLINSSQRYLQTKQIATELSKTHKISGEYAKKIAEFILDHDFSEFKEALCQFDESNFSLLQKIANLNSNVKNTLFAINSIVRIVKALKYYTHINQSKKEVVNIHEGIENTLIILHNQLKHGVNVEFLKGENLPDIEVYVGELNQIWTNLFTNAIDAMKGSGNLIIKTNLVTLKKPEEFSTVYSEKDFDHFLNHPSADTNYLSVSIQDTGGGIPQEIIQKIFDPFFTTKAPGKGTGLGLGIVEKIVEKHHGLITIGSNEKGTRFSIYLPVNVARSIT